VLASTEVVILSYVLPIRCSEPADAELVAYVRALAPRVQLIIVDGSPPDIFNRNAAGWADVAMHLPVDPDVSGMVMGKVAGVVTGLRRAAHERVIVADDDVRYDQAGLAAVEDALGRADVVRPQNYFDPLPWHALLDTARTLLNRVSGGDWPGTLGVRRSMLMATDGYDGDVMFENLELVRTVRAAGGSEALRLDIFVRRLPPTADHFWSQRVRQAYDEFARPVRLAITLTILPVSVALAATAHWTALVAATAVVIGAAETGRRRAGGRRVFPLVASLVAPLWVAERAVCAWLAVGARIVYGGIPYRGRIIARAATPLRILRQRFADSH
jgi:hypothetical protein